MPERVIPITGGSVTIDECDWFWVKDFTWNLHKNGSRIYARAVIQNNPKRLRVYMHKLLMNPPEGFMVDHIDGNGLNNTRANLRVVTRSQNFWNARPNPNTETGYKGVERSGNKFRVRMQCNKKRIDLGVYATAREAALAYNFGAVHYFGEYANLNRGVYV